MAATQVQEVTPSPVVSPIPSRETSPTPKKEESPTKLENNNLPRRKYGALEPNRGELSENT